MEKHIISPEMEGQRLDKYIKRILKDAPYSFIYKMLRKKNIKLNSKKATGREIIKEGDEISLYLSKETMESFKGDTINKKDLSRRDFCLKVFNKYNDIPVLYEDDNIVIINKPTGLMTQKSKPEDESVNDWLLGYLSLRGEFDFNGENLFIPSTLHRLDRNTGGLVICGKTYAAGREMSRIIKDRSLKKLYIGAVLGRPSMEGVSKDGYVILKGYLIKDSKLNTVRIYDKETEGSVPVITGYRVLEDIEAREFCNKLKAYDKNIRIPSGNVSFLEIQLITGKSHQIRAHMAHVGHPLYGDKKYGYPGESKHKEYQFLYSHKLSFPKLNKPFEALSQKVISI